MPPAETKPAASVVTPVPTPIVTQLPTPAPEEHHAAHKKSHAVESRPQPSAHTAESVQAKFQKVRGEYLAFKSQYGGILEERWNAIASEITYGKADKYERVDTLLDALRREMQHVRAGG